MLTYYEEDLCRFANLFLGNTTAYGTEEGGCERPDPMHDYYERVYEHVHGNRPMGVYPMKKIGSTWSVRWGCVDFDEGERPSYIHATNLMYVLRECGITAFRERSRSKGFHVFVFSKDWVEAKTMRRALLGATQVAQAPTKEINPKQETLDDDKLGNYVRLPYPNGWGQTNRRVVINDNLDVVDFCEFVEQAWATRCSSRDLEPLESLWVPPTKIPRVQFVPREIIHNEIDGNLPPLDSMSRKTRTTFNLGPFEGTDRSSTLWKLCNRLADDGYTPTETLRLVIDADLRWGKFMADGRVDMLERMVAKVYT